MVNTDYLIIPILPRKLVINVMLKAKAAFSPIPQFNADNMARGRCCL